MGDEEAAWWSGTYSSRIEHPPPVPVTHPRVQNLAHSEGMRLAGCSGLSEVMSWSAASLSRRAFLSSCSVAILTVSARGEIRSDIISVQGPLAQQFITIGEFPGGRDV